MHCEGEIAGLKYIIYTSKWQGWLEFNVPCQPKWQGLKMQDILSWKHYTMQFVFSDYLYSKTNARKLINLHMLHKQTTAATQLVNVE